MSRAQDFGFLSGDANPNGPIDSISEILDDPSLEVTNDTTTINGTTTIAEGIEGPVNISDLSDAQEILLSFLQIISAMLSLIGSCVIVYKVLKKVNSIQTTTTPYERIILGLSSLDVFASITFALSPFLLSSENSQRVWAIGTKNTCTMLGFMSQLVCFWAVWYNVLLSFYFLLTVRFQVKPNDFARKYELWMHLSGAVFFPITAILGLMGDWYSEEALTMMCWIGDVPKNCKADGVPCRTQLVAYIFGMIPTAICFFSLIINNTVIYLFVRRTLLEKPTVVRNPETVANRDDSWNFSISHDLNDSHEFEPEDAEGDMERRMVQARLTKEVAIQSLLYVTAYLFTIVPAILLSVLDAAVAYDEADQGSLYPLLVLNAMLLPLQGFFNFFIYVRPSYSRFRQKHPDEPVWFVLKQALYNPDIPRLSTPHDSTNGTTTKTGKASRKRDINLEVIVE